MDQHFYSYVLEYKLKHLTSLIRKDNHKPNIHHYYPLSKWHPAVMPNNQIILPE